MEQLHQWTRERLMEEVFRVRQELDDLREIEARYRFMVNHQGEGIGIVDEQETFIFSNPAACEIFGFPEGGLNDHNLKEFVTPDEFEYLRQQTSLRKEGNTNRYEVQLTRPDGTFRHIWISATPVYSKGSFSGTLGIFFDVTDHLRAEEIIRQNGTRLRAITDSAHDAIIMMDAEGNISFWNPAAEKVLGYLPEEVLGKNLHALLVPEHYLKRFATAFPLFRETGQGQAVGNTLELTSRRKDGKEIIISLSLSAVSVDNQWHAVGILRDITLQKQNEKELQEALKRAEKVNKLKSAFIYNISHEVRTPLNGILGFSQLITDPDISEEERHKFFTLLKGSSDRLINTITNYIDISMLASRNMEITRKSVDPVNLLNLLYQKVQPVCREMNLGFFLDLPDSSDQILLNTDAELLRKALGHLLDNAVKFTHQGEIRMGFVLHDNGMEFFIRDTGVGISEDARERVFQTFAQEELSLTRGYEGSGLGLSIADGIVRLLGGSIRLVSEKGQGSHFSFCLPVQPADPSIITEPERVVIKPSGIKPVILVAEDDESNMLFMRSVLSRIAVDLLTASTGLEAVEHCKTNPAINIMLMDLKMPEMDGYEATKTIKAFRPELPVIAVTAFAMSGDRKRAFDAGCDDYLAKPVTIESLYEKLKKFGLRYLTQTT